MSGAPGGGAAQKSGKAMTTKKLIIDQFKKRLCDNIKSLNDNFTHIIQAAKVSNDDNAFSNTTGKMTEFDATKNEMAVRAQLMVQAADELLKLTADLKEFLTISSESSPVSMSEHMLKEILNGLGEIKEKQKILEGKMERVTETLETILLIIDYRQGSDFSCESTETPPIVALDARQQLESRAEQESRSQSRETEEEIKMPRSSVKATREQIKILEGSWWTSENQQIHFEEMANVVSYNEGRGNVQYYKVLWDETFAEFEDTYEKTHFFFEIDKIKRRVFKKDVGAEEEQFFFKNSEKKLDEVLVKSRGWAAIRDSVDFMKSGMEAIIDDQVTSRFEAEQLMCWNMLTRASIEFYRFVNWKLSALWIVGFAFRYCVMLPLRFSIFCIGLVFLVTSTALIGLVPVNAWKRRLNHQCMPICYRILSSSITAVVYFHDEHHKAQRQGICVANHTSPVDALILSIDNVYALIGQKHEGLLGVIQRALSRASSHIWFDRAEAEDRSIVAQRLREHCEHPDSLPILIFPEGTCINNTSVMMFKKGCFEIDTTIYPIAMKYDSRFGDAFWNSSEQSWCGYILRMMTSWAIICHVWYLPPMRAMPDESAADFASRVDLCIAQKGGLVDLEWDGGLKRQRVPTRLVERQRQMYATRFSRYTSVSADLDKPAFDEKHLPDSMLTELPEIDDSEDEEHMEQPALDN